MLHGVDSAVGALARRSSTIDWRAGSTSAAVDEVERVAARFVDAADEPPHGLTRDQARAVLPVVERALAESSPHALMTRGLDDATDLLRTGGPINTAFTDPQANPLGKRGLIYRVEREARERWLGIHGEGPRAGGTVYGEIAFQPPGAPVPGPRMYYGDVALVFPSDAAKGASIAHRDTFSVLDRDAIGGIEHLPDVVLRSRIGAAAIDAVRGADGTIDPDRLHQQLLRELAQRDHGVEQYVEVHVRPQHAPDSPPLRVEDMAEIRVPPGAEGLDELRALARQRGIPVVDAAPEWG